ncbi:CcmD family protein [Pedobacter sp. BS3]|uniref:CcmD family protein n=1 Tax=Pedobacter sp. BS3 TaxID=2567937 RepID=UPI0011ED63B6|nr:CcmD family protein [Pedobacter sp. BS3]TZF83739.1 CcmD family protein [Pedobacter sp. BS3]
MKKTSLAIAFVLMSYMVSAQTATTGFDIRSSGMIYVVVAVITVIFIGIALFLFAIERRIKKLEQDS